MRALALVAPGVVALLLLDCGSTGPAPDAGLPDAGRADGGGAIRVQVVPGSELTATLPAGWQDVPDEHSSVLPELPDGGAFLVFTAGRTAAGASGSGALVLRTTDFATFGVPSGYASPVMRPPERTTCTPALDALFDDNYAAPGSVLEDPTSDAGVLLMLYEAENHCRGGTLVDPFYASVGLARSSDRGRSWPPPSLTAPDRRAVLTTPLAKPTDPTDLRPLGNAVPAGLVRDGYLYAYFTNHPGSAIEVGRASLGSGWPSFSKFADGGWGEPGLAGTATPLVTPPTGYLCRQPSVVQVDAPGVPGPLFLMVMACSSATDAAWYFATASSLETQEWSAPRQVEGTAAPITLCASTGKTDRFDGWYPSLVTPSLPAGHLGAEGLALFSQGCLTGPRTLGVRRITVTRP